MPEPIASSNQSNISGYYDEDARLCVNEATVASASPKAAPLPPPCAVEQPSPAVAQLVAQQKPETKSCATEIVDATLTCGRAAIKTLSGSTSILGALDTLLQIGSCASDLAKAYDCVTERE